MAKSNQKLNEDRNRLLKIIRDKKSEISELEQKIIDIENLRKEKGSIENDLVLLRKEKADIEDFYNQNKGLEDKININTSELEELQTQILNEQKTSSDLQEIITHLNDEQLLIKSTLDELYLKSQTEKSHLESLIKEKSQLENFMLELRDKYGLYSKDMAEMSKDSITQLTTYAVSAFVSIIVTISLMIILSTFLIHSKPLTKELHNFYPNDPYLRFFTILTIRLSISIVFIFLIIIFLNLTRSFVSQYVKSRNRLSALRIADFLVGKINLSINEEDDVLATNQLILKEQTDLLKIHIPRIMDMGSSSFDKAENLELDISKLNKLKELFK
jgi:hypothetical protein